jgi:splicing factor 3B subunit 2
LIEETTTMPTAVNGIAATSDTNTKAIKSRNQLRRAKAKQKKAAAVSNQTTPEPNGAASDGVKRKRSVDFVGDHVEYVVEQLDVKEPAFEAFSDIFAKFQAPIDYSEVRLSAPNLLKISG